VGNKDVVGGSKAARELITKAIEGPNAIVLEEASVVSQKFLYND